MDEDQAKFMARQLDLKAKAGVWFKARNVANAWVVVRVCGDKERIWRK